MAGRLRNVLFSCIDQHPKSHQSLPPEIKLNLEGPYGSPMCEVVSYPVSVCVAGGIGITPFVATCNHIISSGWGKLERLYLLWICKDLDTVSAFAPLLNKLHLHYWNANFPDGLWLQVHITGSTDQEHIQKTLEDFPYLYRRTFIGRPDLTNTLHSIVYPRHR